MDKKMRIDKSNITGNQFMFTIALFLQSSALLTAFLAGVTKQDSWLAVLFGIVLCIPLIFLYRTLMVMFPDRNLIQIFEEVYGVVIGKIIGLTYVWFFITLTALNLTDLGNFAKITVMAETPHVVLTLACMLVVVFAVRYGINVVTRYSPLFTVVEFFIVGISLILVMNQIDIENFLPVFNQPVIKYVQSTHIIATIPFGELVVFLMISPNVRLTPREATKYWFFGVGMGMLIVLVVLLRDIAILGNTLHLFALPGLITLRLVNMGEALSRVEILFAIAVIMLLFSKVAFLCYVTTITIAQIMKTKAFKHLGLIVGLLTVAYGPTIYSDTIDTTTSAREIAPAVWTVFEILIPLITFLFAKLRRLPKTTGKMANIQEV